jgi:hypothetical protein
VSDEFHEHLLQVEETWLESTIRQSNHVK